MRWHASLAALALAGCSGGDRLRPDASGYVGYRASGLASWYGDELAGRPTASGERFAPAGLTAAHRLLPLGTMVEVTAVETGRVVVVRINDRGPYRGGRIIDLSHGAAQLLGTLRADTRVRLRALPPGARPGLVKVGRLAPANPSARPADGRYWLQVASFAGEDRARAMAERIGAAVTRDAGRWRLRLGPYENAGEAQRARDAMATRGYADAQLILIP